MIVPTISYFEYHPPEPQSVYLRIDIHIIQVKSPSSAGPSGDANKGAFIGFCSYCENRR